MSTDINILVVLAILGIHWIADFILQTDKQAKGKSKNWGDLLAHTSIYTVSFLPFYILYYAFQTPVGNGFNENMMWFLPITFICHTATDYFTSRINSQLWKENRSHTFFVSIGFDQLLHFVQLLLTYQLLK